MDTVEKDEGQYDDIVPLLWGTGAALMVRAADWRASGGLDSRFFAHMEEIDLCWRLRTMGKSIVCISASQAYHLGGATLHQGNPRKTFLNFRNNLLMLYKNLPEHELRSVMRVRCLLDYLAALQFLLKGDTKTAPQCSRHDAHSTRCVPTSRRIVNTSSKPAKTNECPNAPTSPSFGNTM